MVRTGQWKEKYVRQGILDEYIDLEKSWLSDSEKKQVMDMLWKYKDTFSLRDEIDTCPNLEIEIDVADKLPLFIWLYHVKEEDKIYRTSNEQMVLFRYIKGRFFSIFKSSYVT